MKVDEPKTPFAGRYDPDMDVEIHGEDIMVDEVEARRRKEEEIPGLELGEPEVEVRMTEDGEKRVIVDESVLEEGQGHAHGEGGYATDEELEKHKKFEEARKKHYEMKNIKDLLG